MNAKQIFLVEDDIEIGVIVKKPTGDVVPVEENGHLSEFHAEELEITIQLPILEEKTVLAPTVVNRKVQGAGFRKSGQLRTVKFGVPIHGGSQNTYTTYPNNSRRVVVIDPSGHVVAYQLSLLGQHGRFALDLRRAYEFQVLKGQRGTTKLTGDVPTWKNLKKLLLRHLEREELPREAPDNIGLEPIEIPDEYYLGDRGCNLGVVDHFHAGRGVGVIQTDAGPLKVHWSQIAERPDGLKLLERGQRVRIGYIKRVEHEPNDGGLTHQAKDVEPATRRTAA